MRQQPRKTPRHHRARGQGQVDVPRGGARARRRVPLRDGARARRTARLLAARSRRGSCGGDPVVRRRRPLLRPCRHRSGEAVVDLGSGSAMDSFIAARAVGTAGSVIGIDMTDEQLAKAERLRAAAGFGNTYFHKAYIDSTGLPSQSCDVIISNGVINLAPDKGAVFREATRLAACGRSTRALGHRYRSAAARRHHLRCDAVGGLHRRRHAGRGLSRGHSAGRFSRAVSHRANPEYRFLFEQRDECLTKVRREKHFTGRDQELSVSQARQCSASLTSTISSGMGNPGNGHDGCERRRRPDRGRPGS